MGALLDTKTSPAGSPTLIPMQRVLDTESVEQHSYQKKERPIIRLIALDNPQSGNMQGVNYFNFECQTQARKANVDGTFEAVLSSGAQGIKSIISTEYRKIPIVNTNGDVLFNSWDEMLDGSGALFSYEPKIYSFGGRNVLTDPKWPTKSVWHGSLPNGETAKDAHCDEWHTGNPEKFGLASSLRYNKLLNQERYPCSSQLIVLCLGVTPIDRLPRKKRTKLRSFEESLSFLRNIEERNDAERKI